VAKRRKKIVAADPAPERAPDRRAIRFAAAGGLLIFAVVAVVLGVVLFGGSGGSENSLTGKRAIIVDQLQSSQPNPDFRRQASDTLSQAGYTVDYVSGDQVDVPFFRTLAEKKYDVVLLRVHAGITTEVDAKTGERTNEEYVSLFTNEPYDENKYSDDQINKLGKATLVDGGEPLFGIGPEFIKSMDGNFNGALVVLMGCDGLRSQKTAQAFLDKGASAFVSWSNQVSGPHTDEATEKLLKHLYVDHQSVDQAVSRTASEVGPDPNYAGELRVLTAGS
jgi:hypothetical protein